MRWFPDIATLAFCETLKLRKMILERQQLPYSSPHQALEPASAEFIAALAAGINSQNILQIGCGLSTIALAAAARATGGCLVSVYTDKEKQDIVRHHIDYLGLSEFVEFIISEPSSVIVKKEDIDFAFFTGDPREYIKLFDLLHLKNGAIVAADNALIETCNEYIRHVRCQPGVDSSTLPLARGIEVTKLVSWENFKSGRIWYSGSGSNNGTNRETNNSLQKQPSTSSVLELTCSLHSGRVGPALSWDEGVQLAHHQQFDACLRIDSLKEAQGPDSIPAILEVTGTPLGNREPDVSAYVVEDSKADPPDNLSQSGFDQNFTAFQSTGSQKLSSYSREQYNRGQSPSSNRAEEVAANFEVHFQNFITRTKVTITGTDQDMLLTDITTAFNDMGVSVMKAKISTQDKLVEDVFYVVTAATRVPIHPGQWDAVKSRILQRISKRRGPAETVSV